ncbi:MAG: hypothetical protein ACRCXZ_10540 [Patescibacteria group bacterium]
MKYNLNETQTAAIASSLAILPGLSVLSPAYLLYLLVTRGAAEGDEKLVANKDTVTRSGFVTLLWLLAASHQLVALLAVLGGTAVYAQMRGDVDVSQIDVKAILANIDSAIAKIKAIDVSGMTETVRQKFTELQQKVVSQADALKAKLTPQEEVPTTNVTETNEDLEQPTESVTDEIQTETKDRLEVVTELPLTEVQESQQPVVETSSEVGQVAEMYASESVANTEKAEAKTSVVKPSKPQRVSNGFASK